MVSSDDFVDAGTIAAAVLAVLLMALSTYGRRRLRHPALRFLTWGASTVFLPLTSSIISNLLDRATKPRCDGTMPPSGRSNPDIQNMWTLLLWTVLFLTIKSNTDASAAAVALATASPEVGDAGIDGHTVRPPVETLVQYAWVAYLVVVCFPVAGWLGVVNKAIFVTFSALGLARLVLKLVTFWSASYLFALGRNARLIAGYMEQLVADGNNNEPVPRYIVMGEKKKHIVEIPQGYRIKREVLEDKLSDLVTLDRLWRLAEDNSHGLIAERKELRDLCLSYSLFKSLRRRLNGYPLADAGSSEALEFVLRGMDSLGSGDSVDTDRVFRVLEDELWFASDFYYSPIPLCLFGGWAAALNHLCSVLIIAGAVATGWFYVDKEVISTTPYYVITFSLLVVLVLVETWDIVAGVSSSWTKMALLGHYIRHQSMWRQSRYMQATLAYLLRLKPARRWSDKIGQKSMLEPRRLRSRTGLLSELLYGRSGLMNSIQVSSTVKEAVFRSLQNSYGRLNKDNAAARQVGGRIDWALYGSRNSSAWNGNRRSITELILMWHIGTSLFEMKSTTSSSSDKMVASHLSNYCMYLVVAAPELLPDCAVWSKKRYEKVAEDLRVVLGGDGGGGYGESAVKRYERLVAALSQDSRDVVLQLGAEIGQHLVKEFAEDQASAWRILADFWSEMLLFVAPSEDIKGHIDAMARGGEFITLVWALLLHAGVTTRPENPGGSIV